MSAKRRLKRARPSAPRAPQRQQGEHLEALGEKAEAILWGDRNDTEFCRRHGVKEKGQ